MLVSAICLNVSVNIDVILVNLHNPLELFLFHEPGDCNSMEGER